MKHPPKLHTLVTTIGFFISTVQCLPGVDYATKISGELRQSVERGNGKILASELEVATSNFKSLLANADFSPAPDTAARIRDATSFAQAILRADSVPTADVRSTHQPVLSAIDAYFSIINNSIDPNWKHLRVSASVMPPQGVINAVVGMSPDAITDPKLKKEYLDIIAENQSNNLRNSQQTELRRSRERILWLISSLVASAQAPGWERSAVLERFGKDSEARAILEAHLKRAGK